MIYKSIEVEEAYENFISCFLRQESAELKELWDMQLEDPDEFEDAEETGRLFATYTSLTAKEFASKTYKEIINRLEDIVEGVAEEKGNNKGE